MSRVWLARDVVLGRDVALKELVTPPGLSHDEELEMRLRAMREARALARLNNPNVVKIFDIVRVAEDDPWIVIEYVTGQSVQDALDRDGSMSPVRAAEIGYDVLNALRAAHASGVVHRDVKPSNVLLASDGRVLLTDFGLATAPDDPRVTRAGQVLGSPSYMAPERANDGGGRSRGRPVVARRDALSHGRGPPAIRAIVDHGDADGTGHRTGAVATARGRYSLRSSWDCWPRIRPPASPRTRLRRCWRRSPRRGADPTPTGVESNRRSDRPH